MLKNNYNENGFRGQSKESAAEKYRLLEVQQMIENLIIVDDNGNEYPAFIKNADGSYSRNKIF